MLLFKTLRFLWPFLKEMVLGNKTLKEALKTNFWRVVLLAAIVVSVALNFFTIPRLLEISYAQVELKRKHSALLKQCWPNSDPGSTPFPSQPEPQPRSAPVTSATSSQAEQDYQRTKDFFERLRNTEH